MPVIVIGADTELGHAVVAALEPASGEIRVLASDADQVRRYRGVAKVAVGDLSDGTHVGGAAIGAFCAIVVATSAHDDRERHFAPDPEALFAQWADGLADAADQTDNRCWTTRRDPSALAQQHRRRVCACRYDREIPNPGCGRSRCHRSSR